MPIYVPTKLIRNETYPTPAFQTNKMGGGGQDVLCDRWKQGARSISARNVMPVIIQRELS
jgi:hypothetical protein